MKSFTLNRYTQSQTVLLAALSLMIVVLFVLTTLLVNAYARLESRLGAEWYQRGTNDLRANNPEQAVIDLRTALSYSREASFRLELARALVAAGRTQEAREYLLSLWERQPGSAELNLELARVAAISQAIPAAIGYYDAAIYGAWDSSPELRRRNTRLELAGFLLAHNDKRRAEAVLTTLAADLPPDAQQHTAVGNLLLQAGDATAALQQFESALQVSRGYVPALQGAGEAAVATHDFTAAERYLDAYLREQPEDGQAQSLLALARTAQRIDPLKPRLSPQERRTRVLTLYRDAQQRIAECSAERASPLSPPDLQGAATKLSSQAANATQRSLQRDPDLIENVFSASAEAIAVSAKWCGPHHPLDDAIIAVAQLHGARP